MKTALLLLLGVSGLLAQFRADVRLVEVYATVYDRKGQYVDGLPRERFQVLDNGASQEILAFESESSTLSCAILLDTTGSMTNALAKVKNAVKKMIDALRPRDSVAIYSFSSSLNTLQEFTQDKNAAKQAVMRTRAEGNTALFDAMAQVAREISHRQGKKAVVVFTDGADNASVLHSDAAANRARKVGVPVYTIAQGDALQTPKLMSKLREISTATGASSYEAKKSDDIENIFADIVGDLQHMYMLAYKPPTGEPSHWRSIQVAVSDLQNYKIRGKEGYLPE